MRDILPVAPAGPVTLRIRALGKSSILLALAITVLGFSARAGDDPDPNVCLGAGFDAKRPLAVSRISTRPHVYFIKGADDDKLCPSDKETCRKKAYLVPGDIVLNGRAQGAFTCVAYQSFHTRKQNWTTGWLPTSGLSLVAPMPSPKESDWIGSWSHPGGTISISRGHGGKLSIAG